MDEERIRIAERNFKNYLDEGKLKKVGNFDNLIYFTYIRNARESLDVATLIFQNKMSSLWVVVASYYSMFYIACAYLYKLGYKSKGEIVHQVINESLIVQGRHKIKNHILENYSEEMEKALSIADQHLENYEKERGKRSEFQYETTELVKAGKAKTSLERAKEFAELIREILQK